MNSIYEKTQKNECFRLLYNIVTCSATKGYVINLLCLIIYSIYYFGIKTNGTILDIESYDISNIIDDVIQIVKFIFFTVIPVTGFPILELFRLIFTTKKKIITNKRKIGESLLILTVQMYSFFGYILIYILVLLLFILYIFLLYQKYIGIDFLVIFTLSMLILSVRIYILHFKKRKLNIKCLFFLLSVLMSECSFLVMCLSMYFSFHFKAVTYIFLFTICFLFSVLFVMLFLDYLKRNEVYIYNRKRLICIGIRVIFWLIVYAKIVFVTKSIDYIDLTCWFILLVSENNFIVPNLYIINSLIVHTKSPIFFSSGEITLKKGFIRFTPRHYVKKRAMINASFALAIISTIKSTYKDKTFYAPFYQRNISTVHICFMDDRNYIIKGRIKKETSEYIHIVQNEKSILRDIIIFKQSIHGMTIEQE